MVIAQEQGRKKRITLMKVLLMIHLSIAILLISLSLYQLHINRVQRIHDALTRANIYMETSFENIMSRSLDSIYQLSSLLKKHHLDRSMVKRILKSFTNSEGKDLSVTNPSYDGDNSSNIYDHNDTQEYLANLNLIPIPAAEIYWIDNKSRLITPHQNNTLDAETMSDLLQTAAIKNKKNVVVISDWTAHNSDQKTYHLLSINLYANDRYLGTLFLKIRIKELYLHFTQRSNISPKSIAPFIISKSGKICIGLSPDTKKDSGMQQILETIAMEITQSHYPVNEYYSPNQWFAIGYNVYLKKLYQDNFYALCITRKDILFDTLMQDIQYALKPIIPLVFFIILFNYYLFKYAIRPMRELSNIAIKVAQGKTKDTIKQYSIHEIDILAASVKSLIDKNTMAQHHSQVLSDFLRASEAGNRAKTLFIRNIQHDFRTPMHHIIAALDILAEEAKEKEKEEAKSNAKYLKIIRSSANQMINMIDDIITITEGVYDHNLSLNKSNVELHNIFHKAICILEEEAATKGIVFNLLIGSNVPHIEADRSLFSVSVIKLLKHSMLFSKENVAISINIDYNDDTISIFIKSFPQSIADYHFDNDIGDIVDNNVKLGLKSAYAIIEAHGGILKIQHNNDQVSMVLLLKKGKENGA